MSDLRADLTRLAFELGATLNTVMDDDERDQLHGHIEKVINDELYAGSVNRAQAAVLVAAFPAAPVIDLREHAGRRSRVVDIFSRRVPRESA